MSEGGQNLNRCIELPGAVPLFVKHQSDSSTKFLVINIGKVQSDAVSGINLCS